MYKTNKRRFMKKYLRYIAMVLCLLSFSVQLYAYHGRIATNIQLLIDSLTNNTTIDEDDIPEYYNIEDATLYCSDFYFSLKPYIIKLENIKTKKASIQFKDNEQSKMYLPHAFCDTLANYLYRFYVMKEPIILSKKKTNIISAREFLPQLKLSFTYKNQEYEDDIIIVERYEDNIIKFSPQYLEFKKWIWYLCKQFDYNHNNPQNAFW